MRFDMVESNEIILKVIDLGRYPNGLALFDIFGCLHNHLILPKLTLKSNYALVHESEKAIHRRIRITRTIFQKFQNKRSKEVRVLKLADILLDHCVLPNQLHIIKEL